MSEVPALVKLHWSGHTMQHYPEKRATQTQRECECISRTLLHSTSKLWCTAAADDGLWGSLTECCMLYCTVCPATHQA